MSQYCTKGKIWLDKKSHMTWCFQNDVTHGWYQVGKLLMFLWWWSLWEWYGFNSVSMAMIAQSSLFLFIFFILYLHNGNLQNSTQIKKNTQEKWNRDSVRFKKIYIKHWMECVTYGQWKNNLISKSYLQYVIIWSICRQKSHDNEAVTVVE